MMLRDIADAQRGTAVRWAEALRARLEGPGDVQVAGRTLFPWQDDGVTKLATGDRPPILASTTTSSAGAVVGRGSLVVASNLLPGTHIGDDCIIVGSYVGGRIGNGTIVVNSSIVAVVGANSLVVNARLKPNRDADYENLHIGEDSVVAEFGVICEARVYAGAGFMLVPGGWQGCLDDEYLDRSTATAPPVGRAACTVRGDRARVAIGDDVHIHSLPMEVIVCANVGIGRNTRIFGTAQYMWGSTGISLRRTDIGPDSMIVIKPQRDRRSFHGLDAMRGSRILIGDTQSVFGSKTTVHASPGRVLAV